MNEIKNLIKYLLTIFIIGIIGIWTSNLSPLLFLYSLYCSKAEFTLKLDNKTYFSEEYVYKVKSNNSYRMLYRFWKIPLLPSPSFSSFSSLSPLTSFHSPSSTHSNQQPTPNSPYIEVTNVKSKYDWYIKDYKGKIYGKFKNPRSVFLVKSLAQKNEVGTVNPSFFKKGTYTLKASYLLFLPAHTDGKLYHMNFKIADKHVPYKEITLTILDPNNAVEQVFPHFPVSSLKKEKGKITLTGTAFENQLVEVELLLKKNPGSPFLQKVNNVKELTLMMSNRWVYPTVYISIYTQKILTLTILLLPLLIFLSYLKLGTEKYFLIPKYLSFIPNKNRKPYLVNLIFQGDAAEADENAFYATLLDLQERGLIKLKENGKVEIYSTNTNDPYEKSALSFMLKFSKKENGKAVFSPSLIERTISIAEATKDVETLKSLKEEWEKVFKYTDLKTTEEFIDMRLPKLLRKIIFILFLLFIPIVFLIAIHSQITWVNSVKIFILFMTLTLQITIIAASPTQLLGRWKKNYYREKLKWEAFKNFLSNFAMIQKYTPEDIVIWKEWLTYGTALGVADKVEESLKKLKIEIPEVKNLRTLRTHLAITHTNLNTAISNVAPSSGGGGGFGVGGGAGGGGAGGR
ncbi:Uncharacterized membrane protein [Desulfurobacterium pacificum]|uniref:Uncharacterized membrane protein n=1 Tax=Desulfurobacterium pacificum TaxID=240166 RepID=A0ABY1NPJ4_9BACT|nr:DUF2207 domain-containing protein [Desulfurobacterium pacificum]SMP14940.1 Uncharacterized membrane protein [Desulfurobacterium pacificum]